MCPAELKLGDTNSCSYERASRFEALDDESLTNCLRVIRNAWHLYYALCFMIKVICGSFGIALLTP
ncbi:DUF3265 domain-containing protein [Vibrio sp. SCSIO 43155]|nr:DUF3265 domain-containing protein [Vibrio sp. SCSIO 43155]